MNKVLFIAALFLCFSADAQTKKPIKKPASKKKTTKTKTAKPVKKLLVTTLNVKTLPKDVVYEGKIKEAVKWKDKSGENIVITTETGKYESKKSMTDEGLSAQLFAYHYLVKGDKSIATWKVNDRMLDCSFDLYVHFMNNSFQVTDLDNDGTAEVWMMYKTACVSDVSPNEMKIIMYEGKQKHAIRGTSKIKENGRNVYGGDYKPDEAFSKAPKEFQEYARQLWQKNEVESWTGD